MIRIGKKGQQRLSLTEPSTLLRADSSSSIRSLCFIRSSMDSFETSRGTPPDIDPEDTVGACRLLAMGIPIIEGSRAWFRQSKWWLWVFLNSEGLVAGGEVCRSWRESERWSGERCLACPLFLTNQILFSPSTLHSTQYLIYFKDWIRYTVIRAGPGMRL